MGIQYRRAQQRCATETSSMRLLVSTWVSHPQGIWIYSDPNAARVQREGHIVTANTGEGGGGGCGFKSVWRTRRDIGKPRNKGPLAANWQRDGMNVGRGGRNLPISINMPKIREDVRSGRKTELLGHAASSWSYT